MSGSDYGSLSDRDLCVVNALLYNDKVYEQICVTCQTRDAATLYDVLLELESSGGDSFDESLASVHTTREDWDRLVDDVLSDPSGTVGSLVVYEYDADEQLGSRNVCFMDGQGVPYVVYRGTGTDEDGTEWYDNALGLDASDTPQQVEARSFANYISQETGRDVVVSGHSKGGNKAMYTAVTSDCVARCVAFDGQGFGANFINTYERQIDERSPHIKNYFTEGDFVSPLLNSVAGVCVCLEANNLNGDFARNHVVNCLLNDSLEFGSEGQRSKSGQMISDFTTWLDRIVSDADREVIGTFLAEVLGAGLGEGDLVAALKNNPEGLGCLVGYVVSYPESGELVQALLSELLCTAVGLENWQPTEMQMELLNAAGDASTRAAVLLVLEILRLIGPGVVPLSFAGADLVAIVLARMGFDDKYVQRVVKKCASTRAGISERAGASGQGEGCATCSVHDLTEESLQVVLRAIDAVGAIAFYNVARWDGWYRVRLALGAYDISGYQGNISNNYRRASDVHDVAKREAQDAFAYAWAIDDDFARRVAGMTGDVRRLHSKINALSTSL